MIVEWEHLKRSMVFHRGLLETKMEEIPEVTKKLAPFAKKQSMKKIRKRYHSEEAVKKALKIESFRNLTKDKVMEFTSMIPYMEKEVALEIIKQFPVYVEFVESAMENYTQLCKTILETNKEEYEQAVHAHQYVLETFANQLEQENLTEEERREFSEKMMEEADKITELYLQQQKFHERVFKTIGGVVTLALGVTVTMLGLKAIGSDEDLPQLV